MTGYERWNLVLVLGTSVVGSWCRCCCSLSVFAFLMVFGWLIMTEPVLGLEHPATARSTSTPRAALVQVSVFLAAFSGLYLTVSTVTDEAYQRPVLRQRHP